MIFHELVKIFVHCDAPCEDGAKMNIGDFSPKSVDTRLEGIRYFQPQCFPTHKPAALVESERHQNVAGKAGGGVHHVVVGIQFEKATKKHRK